MLREQGVSDRPRFIASEGVFRSHADPAVRGVVRMSDTLYGLRKILIILFLNFLSAYDPTPPLIYQNRVLYDCKMIELVNHEGVHQQISPSFYLLDFNSVFERLSVQLIQCISKVQKQWRRVLSLFMTDILIHCTIHCVLIIVFS